MADGSSDTPRRTAGVGRIPPHNLEAEESLLGAMLLSAAAVASAVEVVSRDDFYKPAHGHIFDAITSLYGAGEPVDPVTVADELRRADLLEAIGGASILVDLQATTPATSNAAATPTSSRSTRCCAGSSASPARSPSSATACPTT